jgi:hypothetical protein
MRLDGLEGFLRGLGALPEGVVVVGPVGEEDAEEEGGCCGGLDEVHSCRETLQEEMGRLREDGGDVRHMMRKVAKGMRAMLLVIFLGDEGFYVELFIVAIFSIASCSVSEARVSSFSTLFCFWRDCS